MGKVKTGLILGCMAMLLGLPMLVQAQGGPPGGGPPGGGPPGGGGNLAARVTDLEAGQATLLSAVSNIQIDINALLTAVAELQEGGGGGGVSQSDDPVNWEGTHTWKTDGGPGTGKTLKTFSATLAGETVDTLLISIPVPTDHVMFLRAWAGAIAISGSDQGLFGGEGNAVVVTNIGGTVEGAGTGDPFAIIETGGLTAEFSFIPNGTNVDVTLDRGTLDPVIMTGWIEYSSVPIPTP